MSGCSRPSVRTACWRRKPDSNLPVSRFVAIWRSAVKILITASASGIGAVTAREAIRDGHEVILSDIDAIAGAQLAEELGARFEFADLACEGDIKALIRATGAVDLLVNNGGISGPTAPVTETSTEEWRHVFAVNVTAQFIACREMVPLMRAAGGGSIVNMSSVAARIGYPNRSAYAASKRAVLGLTAALAREVGGDDIRVNAVLPGTVRGARIDAVIERYTATNHVTVEEARQHYLSRHATGRFVEPVEVARMILYLGGDAARSITGQFINVDGGFE